MASNSRTSAGQAGPQMDMNPRAINVGAFTVARADEINTMMRSISTMGSVQRTFQKLPRHMQRRAMSHNIKRMPRRLRDVARIEAEKNPQKKPKSDVTGPAKKSRRHRRRPGNLREEYARRQMRTHWLETHIWHAKRFKMVEHWGWKIPLHPSDKSARAVYRATARHCVMSDISYHQVIEVQGSEVNILSAMKHLTSPQVGLTMASKAFLHGTRHGEVLLYHKDTYPHRAIGPVDYLWQCTLPVSPPEGTERQELNEEERDVDEGEKQMRIERKLWIWVHPSCWKEVLAELKALGSNYNVFVTPLEDELLRYRLQGPLAHPILLDALQIAMVTPHDNIQDERGGATSYWWDKYYEDAAHLQIHKQQKDVWTGFCELQSTSEIPTNAVVSLVVRDPRIVLPKKRTKVMVNPDDLTDELSNPIAHKLPPETSISPLWSSSVRKTVAAEQRPNHELNQLRSKLLVPGTELNLGQSESRIPVLLLHHPGIRSSVGNKGNESTGMLGYGGGWDLVLPWKWGMPFWVGLVYRGARACGLREAGKGALYCSMPRFPYDFPDSEAGCSIGKSIANDLEQTFLRKPPAKRPNHAKLGIAAPFCPPWSQLISEWVRKETCDQITESGDDVNGGSKIEDWYVLRNKEKLSVLRTVMQEWFKKQGREGRKQGKWYVKDGKGSSSILQYTSNPRASQLRVSSTTRTEGKECLSFLEPLTQMLVPSENKTVVWVGLRMVNRGFPSQFAVICLPSATDLAKLNQNPNYGGPEEHVHKEFCLQRKRKLEKGQKSSKAKKAKIVKEGRPEPPSTPRDFGYGSESKEELGERFVEITKELGSSRSNIDGAGSMNADAADLKCGSHNDGMVTQEKQTLATMSGSNITKIVSAAADKDPVLTEDVADSKQAASAKVSGTHTCIAMAASEQPMTPMTTHVKAAGNATTNTDNQMKLAVSEASAATTSNEKPATVTSKSSDTSLPPTHPELLKSCTRSVIGFVTNGAQSFSCGKGMGVGFCATLGLLNLLKDSPRGRKLVVLVRDVQSLQYRFAFIYIPSS